MKNKTLVFVFPTNLADKMNKEFLFDMLLNVLDLCEAPVQPNQMVK